MEERSSCTLRARKGKYKKRKKSLMGRVQRFIHKFGVNRTITSFLTVNCKFPSQFLTVRI